MNLARALRRAHELGRGMVAFRIHQRARRRWSSLRADWFGEPHIGSAEAPDWGRVGFFLVASDREWLRQRFERHLPSVRAALLSEAEAALTGRVRLLTGELHDFGGAVPWNLDPRSGAAPWPRIHFARLDVLRLGETCDVKIPWEIGRGTHLMRFAQAYALTGEERFAAAAAAGIESFLRENPPEFGPQWINGMEVGLRVMHWIWIDWLCSGSAAFSNTLRGQLWWGIREGVRYIARFPERDPVSGNHYWFNGLGRWYGAHFMGPAGRGHARAGRDIVFGELFQQTRPDGTSIEQSTGYHRLVTELMLHALRLAELEGAPAPEAAQERVRAMLRFTSETLHPGGRAPHLGDHDDGRVVAFADLPPWDHRHLLAMGAGMLPGVELPELDDLAESEADWFLGRRSGNSAEAGLFPPGFPGLAPVPCGASAERLASAATVVPTVRTEPTVAFPEGGVYVLRARLVHSAWDAGPLGKPGNGVHGHLDTLSGEVSVAGVPVLVDSGTWGYTADPARRNRFRGTAAHNVVQVDGLELAGLGTGEDLWRFFGDVPARVLEFGIRDGGAVLRAEHTGYRERGLDVVVRREVRLELSGRRLTVRDEIAGTGSHRATLRWHLAGLEWQVNTADGLSLSAAAGRARIRLAVRGDLAKTSVTEAERSVRWGELHRDPVLVVEADGPLPLSFETTLDVTPAGEE